MLQFISNTNTQSFWFTLNTSYNHGCHLASRFHLDLKDYKVVSPLVMPPWCHLVTPAGCCIASCRPLVAPPSHRLVASAGCCIASRSPLIALPSRCLVAPAGSCIASPHPLVASPSYQLVALACWCIASARPLVAPRTALSSSRRAGWLLRCLSPHCPLVVLLTHRAASRCLVAPAGCRAIISCHCRPLVSPPSPSRPLIMLAGCCVASPCATLSSSRRSPSLAPSNAVEHCCRH
jgi:hypothetical protein